MVCKGLPQKAISVFMWQLFMMMRVYPASCYGSMMLKGLVPVIRNWFMFSIIRVSSSVSFLRKGATI